MFAIYKNTHYNNKEVYVMEKIIAGIFGFIALMVYIISMQTNNKKKLLIFLIISNIFYALQYLMLDAYAGLFVSLIGMFRSMIFLKFEKEKKEIPLYVLFVIWGLVLYSGILSYDGLISLIPLATSFIYAWVIWQKNLKIFRMFCLVNALSWIFYNYVVGAYVGAISSIIELVFAIIAVVRLDLIKGKK